MSVNDDELERRAVEELLKEANRGRVRAETMGPAGWMKCPLGSTNKRFLRNTLRPYAADRRPGSRSASARGADDRKKKGDRYHPEDREHGNRKDTKHKGQHSHSHSPSSRPCSSSTSELASTSCPLHHANRSNGARSRSPIRERLTVERSTNTTGK